MSKNVGAYWSNRYKSCDVRIRERLLKRIYVSNIAFEPGDLWTYQMTYPCRILQDMRTFQG